jgi:hypothetical protein
MGAFGLLDDCHHIRVPGDRIVEANPRLDIWMLLQCGALTEGTTTALRWGEKGSQLLRRAPNIFVDGNPILVVWDEPMSGVGRCWFECPRCSQRCRHIYVRQLACRRCSRLDYSSRHLHRSVPGLNRLRYLRGKLGLELRPFAPIPPRPSSHTRYHRIVAEIHALEAGLVGHLMTDINDVLARRLQKPK